MRVPIKINRRRFKVPIYPANVDFYFFREESDWNSLKEKEFLEVPFDLGDFKGWTGISRKKDFRFLIVFNLNRLKSFSDALTTLRHEVHHVSAEIFEYIGESIFVLDAESFMYLNDTIFEIGISFLKEFININS